MRRVTRVFKENREPRARRVAAFYVLQLRAHHETLRIVPVMAAGMTDHVWSLEEIAALAN
jgi:hypothetical protein